MTTQPTARTSAPLQRLHPHPLCMTAGPLPEAGGWLGRRGPMQIPLPPSPHTHLAAKWGEEHTKRLQNTHPSTRLGRPQRPGKKASAQTSKNSSKNRVLQFGFGFRIKKWGIHSCFQAPQEPPTRSPLPVPSSPCMRTPAYRRVLSSKTWECPAFKVPVKEKKGLCPTAAYPNQYAAWNARRAFSRSGLVYIAGYVSFQAPKFGAISFKQRQNRRTDHSGFLKRFRYPGPAASGFCQKHCHKPCNLGCRVYLSLPL